MSTGSVTPGEKHQPEGWEGKEKEVKEEEEAACLGEFKFLELTFELGL